VIKLLVWIKHRRIGTFLVKSDIQCILHVLFLLLMIDVEPNVFLFFLKYILLELHLYICCVHSGSVEWQCRAQIYTACLSADDGWGLLCILYCIYSGHDVCC